MTCRAGPVRTTARRGVGDRVHDLGLREPIGGGPEPRRVHVRRSRHARREAAPREGFATRPVGEREGHLRENPSVERVVVVCDAIRREHHHALEAIESLEHGVARRVERVLGAVLH